MNIIKLWRSGCESVLVQGRTIKTFYSRFLFLLALDPFIQYITIHSHFQPCIHPYAFCYLFKACRAQIMSLQPTQEGDVLYTVFSYSRAPRAYNVNFTSASPACEVSSWTYQKCGGQWLPYNPSKSSPRLSLQYSSSDAWFQLKVWYVLALAIFS